MVRRNFQRKGTGRYAYARAHKLARESSPNGSALINYHVTLPKRLPLSDKEIKIHNLYSAIRKTGYTEAVSPEQAVNNFFYAMMGGFTRIVYHTLKENGKRLGGLAEEVYTREDSESEAEHNARLQREAEAKALAQRPVSESLI